MRIYVSVHAVQSIKIESAAEALAASYVSIVFNSAEEGELCLTVFGDKGIISSIESALSSEFAPQQEPEVASRQSTKRCLT